VEGVGGGGMEEGTGAEGGAGVGAGIPGLLVRVCPWRKGIASL